MRGPVVDRRDTVVQTYHTLAKLNNTGAKPIFDSEEMSPN